MHAPVAGDLQLVQPSVQAPAVRRLKPAPALAEQVEVEGKVHPLQRRRAGVVRRPSAAIRPNQAVKQPIKVGPE